MASSPTNALRALLVLSLAMCEAHAHDDGRGHSAHPAAVPPSPALVSADGTILAETCANTPVRFVAATSDERRLGCSAAEDAIRLLARCGIAPRRSLLVQIVAEVRHPAKKPIFGYFDPKQEKVFATQATKMASLMTGTPYAGLSPDEFFKSMIVHKLVHGVMHQNYKRTPGSHAAYEYPAYALQIESLPPGVRDEFLRSVLGKAGPGDFLFNDIVLFFDPSFFAAHAYRHFTASPNGCAHLHALLAGDVAFVPTLPP